MKKTAIVSAMFTAAFCAFSCQKEAGPDGNGFEGVLAPVTINAVTESLGGGTKSEVAYTYDLLWEEGDEIRVIENSNANHQATFNLASGAGTKSGTFEKKGTTSLGGSVIAYYPASLVDNGGLTFWPSEQTVDQQVPLYSTGILSGSEGDKFVFSSLGAVLQIVFNTTVKDITLKSIEIRDDKQRLCGRFGVRNGIAGIENANNADSNNGIRLNLGSGTPLGKGPNSFNICIPAGNYQNLTLIFTATDGRKCIMTGGKVNLERGEIGKISLTGSKFKNYVLPGEFSVNDWGKKVRFSVGNLYWNGSAFKMEENQYDYPTSVYSNHVGHFYWHSDPARSIADGSNLTLKPDTELFTNATDDTANPEFIVCSQKGLFRVLSGDEWIHLVQHRPNAENLRKGGVTVCGKANCLVIAPDNWDGGTIADSYTADAWKAASEKKGLVCLPHTGERRYYSNSIEWQEYCEYLANYQYDPEHHAGHINVLFFQGNWIPDATISSKPNEGQGHPIRLVTDVND